MTTPLPQGNRSPGRRDLRTSRRAQYAATSSRSMRILRRRKASGVSLRRAIHHFRSMGKKVRLVRPPVCFKDINEYQQRLVAEEDAVEP